MFSALCCYSRTGEMGLQVHGGAAHSISRWVGVVRITPTSPVLSREVQDPHIRIHRHQVPCWIRGLCVYFYIHLSMSVYEMQESQMPLRCAGEDRRGAQPHPEQAA